VLEIPNADVFQQRNVLKRSNFSDVNYASLKYSAGIIVIASHRRRRLDSAPSDARSGDIVCLPEEKQRSHCADIAGIESASKAKRARSGKRC
jgi:hypothetical protein